MRLFSIIVSACALMTAVGATPAHAKMQLIGTPDFGFTPIAFISPSNFSQSIIAEAQRQQLIKHYCTAVGLYYDKYKWKDEPCGNVPWKTQLKTKNGHPLIYAEFGGGKETMLILGGVHPDELTPVHVAFRVARFLHENPKQINPGIHVVIAPLVNPDGFLRNLPTRTNSNGVDLNRNFFTLDWFAKAKRLWQDRRERAAKHFPGYFPNSEIETLFQIQLVDQYKPDKILSIHAPLGFLDYDGPGDGDRTQLSPTQKRAKQLVHSISEKSQNYKVVDYTFYPGSLGNFAGNERHIPTVTLELETTDPDMVNTYWTQFLPGILQSIHYPFKLDPEFDRFDNATPFSADYSLLHDGETI